jgi:ribosomal protein S18 acetylase RimI-like enzyme
LIRIEVDPALAADDLDALWRSAWGSPAGDYAERVLPRSLAYLAAFDGGRLVGFVNVAWDGGIHAFILDTCVHADFQRRGIASDLVRRAAEVAKERGAEWLHVDFEPHLEGFYRGCGFRPTAAGLIDLSK